MRSTPARLLPRLGASSTSGSNGAPFLLQRAVLGRVVSARECGSVAGHGCGCKGGSPMNTCDRRSGGSIGGSGPAATAAAATAAATNLAGATTTTRGYNAGMGSSQRQQRLRPRPTTTTVMMEGLTTLTHVDAGKGQPAMVDVGDKAVTKREARARCRVVLPPEVMGALLRVEEQGKKEVLGKKGPVFATAIVAGVMGAKRTSELLPFCHPLALDDCQIDLRFDEPLRPNEVVVDCAVKVQGRTGVEMEAMTGASVAALCVYDMCKAASHDIVIKGLQLLSKSGGKRGDVQRSETMSTNINTNISAPPRSLSAAATPPSSSSPSPSPFPTNKDNKEHAPSSASSSAAAVERGKRLVMHSTYKGLNGGHPPSSFSSYSRPPSQDGSHPLPPPSVSPAEARFGGEGRMQMEESGKKEEKLEAPVVDYCI